MKENFDQVVKMKGQVRIKAHLKAHRHVLNNPLHVADHHNDDDQVMTLMYLCHALE